MERLPNPTGPAATARATAHPPFGRLAAAMLLLAAAALAQRPTAVFGTVLGLDGRPAPDVLVRAFAVGPRGLPAVLAPLLQQEPSELGAVRSDERGRFRFELVRAEPIALVAGGAPPARGAAAAKDGIAPRSAVLYPVAPGSVVDLPLLATETRRGKVEPIGEDRPPALGGMPVRVYVQRAPESAGSLLPGPHRHRPRLPFLPLHETTLAADGSFAVHVPVATGFELELPRLGCARTVAAGAALELRVLVNARPRRVVDAGSRAPLAGATIRPEHARAGGPAATSGADGTLALCVADDAYLLCSASGYRPEVWLANTEELRLQAGPTSRVRIVDAARQPLADARLVLVHWTNGPVASLPVPVLEATDGTGVVECHGDYAVTGWLREDDALVRLFALEAGRAAGEPIVVAARREVQGTVLGPDGAPAAHVPVFAVRTDAPERERVFCGKDPVAWTDHGGRFRISPVTDGDLVLAVRSRDGLPTVVEHRVTAAGKPVELRIAPAPRVRGRIVDRDGAAGAGLLVGLHCGDGVPESWTRWFALGEAWVRTDADGRFELPAIALGRRHTLAVQRGREPPQTRPVDVPAAGDAIVDLEVVFTGGK